MGEHHVGASRGGRVENLRIADGYIGPPVTAFVSPCRILSHKGSELPPGLVIAWSDVHPADSGVGEDRVGPDRGHPPIA